MVKKIIKLFLGFVVVVVIIALGIGGYRLYSLPTTTDLEDFFALKQSVFEEKNRTVLAALAQGQQVATGADETIGYHWLEIEPPPLDYSGDAPITIRYYTHIRGVGVASFGAGIAYLTDAESNIYPSIEAMSTDAKKVEGFIGYTQISGNWYSFFWESD